MKICYGAPQSDAWLRARCGRICGSQIIDACSYLTRNSGTKKPGDSSATRDKYRLNLIAERLTGRLSDHVYTPAMQWGNEQEAETIGFYESLMRVMAVPVGFVIHEEFDFWGSTPDALIGEDGVLEVKNPNTVTHLTYFLEGVVAQEYIPQVASQLACCGKERRYADFVSRDSRIQNEKLRYFYKRTGRDELEWTIGAGKDEIKLTGEAVIDYFTSEAVKMNAEIKAFLAEHNAKAIAPFPLDFREEEAPDPGYDASKGFDEQNYDFLDSSTADVP